MPAEHPSWQISAPQTLDFDGPVEELRIRVEGGTVNVVGTAGPGARIEVSEVRGGPLAVRREGGTLVVAYEDTPWTGLLKWLEHRRWVRQAVISVSVPAAARLSVAVMGADAVVSGVTGPARVCGVSGGLTLVGLAGSVRAETVTGDVEAQRLTGSLHVSSVNGDLTVVEGGGSSVRADSVTGDMILDLDPDRAGDAADVRLTTVSGEIAIRLPHPLDARVEADTASGAVSCAFDELKVDGQWGAKRVTGTLGTGSGKLRATTVSGAIALLRRPAPAAGEALSLSKDA